jgi:hypothetical protein
MENTNPQQPKQKLVLSFALLFLLIGVIGLVARMILKDLQPQVGAAFVVAASTVMVSVASVLIAKHYERQAEIQREHMKRKAEIYERQIQFWFSILFAPKLNKPVPNDQELMAFFNDTMKDLITWGGDGVLHAYRRFRASAAPASQFELAKNMIFVFEELLFEMRKDLGHANSGLGRGDLLRMFITDFDDTLGAAKREG